MSTEEMINVMQDYLDGKEIETRVRGTESHWVMCSAPLWDWDNYEYRSITHLDEEGRVLP